MSMLGSHNTAGTPQPGRTHADHRKLLLLVQELEDACAEGCEPQLIDGIIDRIVECTQFHFATEEALMTDIDPFERARLRAEHDCLIQSAFQMRSQLEDTRGRNCGELVRFLQAWLVDHIQRADQRDSHGHHTIGLFLSQRSC